MGDKKDTIGIMGIAGRHVCVLLSETNTPPWLLGSGSIPTDISEFRVQEPLLPQAITEALSVMRLNPANNGRADPFGSFVGPKGGRTYYVNCSLDTLSELKQVMEAVRRWQEPRKPK